MTWATPKDVLAPVEGIAEERVDFAKYLAHSGRLWRVDLQALLLAPPVFGLLASTAL